MALDIQSNVSSTHLTVHCFIFWHSNERIVFSAYKSMVCESRAHVLCARLSLVKVVHSVGGRLKVWREAVSLKQDEAAARLGLSASTYQNYERDTRSPNAAGFQAFVSAGINANWLLTGNGPMLLADLVAPTPAAPQKPAPPKINVDALAHAYAVTLQTAPKGETLAQSARKAVAFYQYCWEQGLITEDGEGRGHEEGAA